MSLVSCLVAAKHVFLLLHGFASSLHHGIDRRQILVDCISRGLDARHLLWVKQLFVLKHRLEKLRLDFSLIEVYSLS